MVGKLAWENGHKAVNATVFGGHLPDFVESPVRKVYAPEQLRLWRGNDLVRVTQRSQRVHPDRVRHCVADAERRGDDCRAQHQPHRDEEDALREPPRDVPNTQLDQDWA